MDPIGVYLKQARKKKGVSLEHVASQTKIQKHHLQALESEDFANLPAKVFVKGFVRSYAKALGIDEEEALQAFLQTSGTFYDQHQSEHPQPHVQVTLEAAPRQGINWTLVFGVIVVIGVSAIWYSLPEKPEAPIVLSEPESPSTIEPVEAPMEAPVTPKADSQESIVPINPVESGSTIPSSPVPDSVPSQAASKPDAPASVQPIPPDSLPQPANHSPTEGPQILEIEAAQLTWVVVQSDDRAPNEALLQPGQRITWKADTQFLITLGNAAGVVIRLNGEPQGPFGNPGQVVRNIRLRP